jgi:type II secretory pathway component HofQ
MRHCNLRRFYLLIQMAKKTAVMMKMETNTILTTIATANKVSMNFNQLVLNKVLNVIKYDLCKAMFIRK